MRIIAGLGNPGRRYAETRHNVGWMAANRIAERCKASNEELRWGGVLARCGELWLFKPLSYMNLCGPSIAWLCRETCARLEDVLVLVDDLNLPLGRIRLRASGSSGGHRGLASLIAALGTEGFARLRMGIGACPPGVEARQFVLSAFAPEEWELVERMTEDAAEAALCWAQDGIEAAMSAFNRREREP